jgi:hypothetical protein
MKRHIECGGERMNESAKETVVIVHGTWAAPKSGTRRWYQPFDPILHPDGFVAKLDSALQERGSPARCWAHCTQEDEIFTWSGDNTWIARAHGTSELVKYLTNLLQEGWRCHIIAHSHGGNLVVEALPQITTAGNLSGRIGKVVTLGTPFMDTMSLIRDKFDRQQYLPKSIG